MKCTPLGENLGADIGDLDLSKPLLPEQARELKDHWYRHLVLRFRDQRLNDDQLMRFSQGFGELDLAPLGLATAEQRAKLENAYVTVISNIVEKGRRIGGLGAYEAEWHADMAYQPEPATGSVLYAIEIPPEGGDTGFTSMYGAYESLSPELRKRIAGLNLKHDASYTSVGGLRTGFEDTDDPREAPGVVHSLVVLHPETRRPALLLGRRKLAYIPGLSLDESEALLDELWSYAALPENGFTQQWAVGDVVIWDNRRVLHRRAGFDPSERRMMRRCQVLPRIV